MKIAIYGISRAGKDFLINKFVQNNSDFYHLKGSETLKDLSMRKLKKPFIETSEDEKVFLRLEFAKEIISAEKKYNNVVVDGHYAFVKENGEYNTVFTEKDRDIYDVFIYLKPSAEKVIENQKNLKDGKKVRQYTKKEIESWQNFEITEMQKICKEIDKELIVIDDCLDDNLSFLSYLKENPKIAFPREMVRNMISANMDTIKRFDTVLITDCDKTLSVEDTGELFFQNTGIEKSDIKKIFKGDYYSVYQFYKFNLLCKKIAQKGELDQCCDFAFRNTQINTHLYEDIYKGKENVLSIGLTTGIFEIWSKIRESIEFPKILFGNKVNSDGRFITATVKRMMVEELRMMGKYIIAVGDGILDVSMLEQANKAYLVAQQKLSDPVIRYLSENKSSIKQLEYNKYKYDNTEIVGSIWD